MPIPAEAIGNVVGSMISQPVSSWNWIKLAQCQAKMASKSTYVNLDIGRDTASKGSHKVLRIISIG
ncbi:hypothetical protein MKX08_003237 [Trichoderma sp. CBMAI-0020]|nr:hypothetical protein MKX08_003237 [Trichoderma sp. CBMAI-0020]